MNVNPRNNKNVRGSTPDDLLKVLALNVSIKSQLLDLMIISKSLTEAIEEWLLDLKIEGRSKATIRFYRQNLEPFREFIEASGPADLKLLNTDSMSTG